jgi:hypothetical protein
MMDGEKEAGKTKGGAPKKASSKSSKGAPTKATETEVRVRGIEKGFIELSLKIEALETTLKELYELVPEAVKANLGSVNGKIENLEKQIEVFRLHGGRGRGPKSTRDMTEEDARRVIHGDLRTMSIRKAAELLGLSYGQVYSAKNGYTFKYVQSE